MRDQLSYLNKKDLENVAVPFEFMGRFLLETVQTFLDRVEIRQILRSRGLFGVANHAFLVHDEGGTRASGTEAQQVIEQHAIIGGGLLVEIAGQRDGDVFLRGPGFLRESGCPH